MNIAIVFASGKGTRFGTEIPKQFLNINGKPILIHTLELFQYHNMIDKIYIATLNKYIDYVEKLCRYYGISKLTAIVEGGETAQDSIYNALKCAQSQNSDDSIVLIHDGVRPYVSSDVITNNIEGVKRNGNAITCVPAYETILISNNGKKIDDVTKRIETYVGQAPQSFYLKDIVEAHEIIRQRPQRYQDMVDACTIYRTLGKDVYLVEGNRGNIKVTTPEDVFVYKAYIQFRENEQAFGLGRTNNIGIPYSGVEFDDGGI